jgi:signal transduction histidine kinase
MHFPVRAFLQSNRRFYLAVTVIFVLLIGAVAVFQWTSLKRITEIVDDARGMDRYETCLNAVFNLQDYSWDTFASHVAAVNNVPVVGMMADSRKVILDKLAALPGVRCAYYLENSRDLYASPEPSPSGMADVLAAQRRTFGKYFHLGERPTEKIDNMLRNRVRFLDVPFQGDTLRMLVGAFDANGSPIHILPALKANPSQAPYLIALDLDPQWIREAVTQQMDYIYHSRWSFILWSPPPFDSTAQWLQGLGVIALGDTVWWRGPKTVKHGLVFPTGEDVVEWSNWLRYVAVYEEDPKDLAHRAEYFRSYYLIMGLVDAAAVIFAGLLVIGLAFVRKQWLARQTALTHLAHAIRTPVARLRLEVDTLHEKRAVSPEEETEVIQSIGTECGRIERAVQNASLSLNGNGHTVERMPGDLSQIIKDALRPWETSYKLAGISLELPVNFVPISGRYDREMIVTLLDNLLDNALRHTRISLQNNPRRTQKVAVSLKKDQGFAVLMVDDSDGGVPVEDRQRIFRRFERGSDPSLTGASGLGLGLSLVKEIAESHGGSVSVSDSPLGGACFTVRIAIEDIYTTSRN